MTTCYNTIPLVTAPCKILNNEFLHRQTAQHLEARSRSVHEEIEDHHRWDQRDLRQLVKRDGVLPERHVHGRNARRPQHPEQRMIADAIGPVISGRRRW